jgi:hypothetical protein
MIPKTIWQTYEAEYESLPENIKDFLQSWQSKYLDFKFNYVNAEQRKNFVLNEFGKDWYEIFISMPNNITRANLWTYMNMYINGGIYMDLDMLPLLDINEWLKDDYDFIVWHDSSEEVLFSIAMFACSPKHPILKSVIDNILIDIKDFNNFNLMKDKRLFVLKFAEIGFTKGIKNFLDNENQINKTSTYKDYNNLKMSKLYKFHCYPEDFYEDNPVVLHTDGANNWHTGYNNWWREVGYNKKWERKV